MQARFTSLFMETKEPFVGQKPPNTPQPPSPYPPSQQHKGGTDSRLYGRAWHQEKHLLYKKWLHCSEQKGVLSMTWTQIPCER